MYIYIYKQSDQHLVNADLSGGHATGRKMASLQKDKFPKQKQVLV